ncbi:MAG: hypothetical protein NTZ76_00975, partial [Actinobacteria bacterium]|nr:hypothetical protein [Actinomycetota bacterium]
MIECVVNISEGQNPRKLAKLSAAVTADLLDIHTDPDHHRSVFTLRGTLAPRLLATSAVNLLNVHEHTGVHPRLGVVDVVPFVPLGNSTFNAAIHERNAFAQWAADELDVPSFLYGPERTLPDIRRTAWTSLFPDVGPRT